MCMTYKGVPYEYAFTFKFPIENCQYREFNVVISDYREESQDFSGLCLENELRVVSEKQRHFEAFYEIVDTITTISIAGEKVFRRDYPGEELTPCMSVTDSNFIRKFEKYKQSKQSLEYYDTLKLRLGERTVSAETEFNAVIVQIMKGFSYIVQKNESLIQDIGFFLLGGQFFVYA